MACYILPVTINKFQKKFNFFLKLGNLNRNLGVIHSITPLKIIGSVLCQNRQIPMGPVGHVTLTGLPKNPHANHNTPMIPLWNPIDTPTPIYREIPKLILTSNAPPSSIIQPNPIPKNYPLKIAITLE